MDKIDLLTVPEHGELTALYRAAGLEIGDGWIEECHPVFSVAAYKGAALLGGATVSRRFDRLVLDYLAVEPSARGTGLGKRLTARCIRYAREVGETALWIAAKEPGFYRHLEAKETEDTALLTDCLHCPDYGKDCKPEEMVFDLKESK